MECHRLFAVTIISVKFLNYYIIFSKQLTFQSTHAKYSLSLISCPGKYSIISKPVTFLISVSVLFLRTLSSAFTLFAFYLSLNYVLYYKCGGCLVNEIFVTVHQHEIFQTFRKALYQYFLANPLHHNNNGTCYFI